MKTKKLKFNSRLLNYLLLSLIAIMLIGSLVGADLVLRSLQGQAQQLVALKAKTIALTAEQTNLIIAKKEVAKYTALEKIAESVVPQDKGQAETVREIVNIAAASNIKLTAIIFPSSSLGSPTSSAATGAASQKFSISQLTTVKGIPGVYVLPIEVEDSQQAYATTYANFYSFLTKLEQNRRTSQVINLTIKPLTDGSGLIQFTLTLNEYIKPL